MLQPCTVVPDHVKRHKVAADELLCPITLELPFDPVMAEDGRVYERYAIEQHIAQTNKSSTSREALRSPITNEPMGSRLVSSLQIKNLIATLIENNSITGDLADSWKRMEEQKKAADRMLIDAQNGDADAMYFVGAQLLSSDDENDDDSLAFDEQQVLSNEIE